MTDIVTLADGEIAPGPGAYRMSMAHYHSQDVCMGTSVSSTGIRLMETVSPWAFWSMFASLYPEKDKSQFSFGRAAHCLLLGDEDFASNYAVLPFKDRRTNAAKEWVEKTEASGITIITEAELEAIKRMAENLSKVPLVQSGILDGQPEVSLIWQDEHTGIWLKSRPDMIQLNGEVVADLKTTSDAGMMACQRSITTYAYDMQFALAIEGIERIFGVTATDAVVIFAEKSAPYHVRSMPIEAEHLYWAKQRVRRGINMIAECLKNPPLPIFEDDETPYSPPPSLVEKLVQQQQEGTLPNV